MSMHPEVASLIGESSFNRRRFCVTALGAGFALAVQPALAQSAITTDSQGLFVGEVKIPVGDGEMLAYRAAPQGALSAPLVLVVSEIFGVHEYMRDVCRRLAKLGYFAVAPELFARQGDQRSIASIPEIQQKITSRTPDAQVMADLDAALAWAEKAGGDGKRVAITGFCWGGRIAWLYAAHQPRLRAGAAWYGRLVGASNEFTPRHPGSLANELKAPVLGLYGGLDSGIPLETVEAMEAALKDGSDAAQASSIHVYDNAPHAFHADYRPSYRKEEAEDAWRRMLAWFREKGV